MEGGEGVQKIAQNDKTNLSHSVSQELYLIWLWFLVHMCKMMISPAICFSFLGHSHQMEYLLPQNAFHQISQLSWFFQTIWNPVRNSKNEGSRELFLPENDFQNSSTNFFSKKHPYFIFLHMPFYIWTQYNIKIVLGTYNFLSFIFLEVLILER